MFNPSTTYKENFRQIMQSNICKALSIIHNCTVKDSKGYSNTTPNQVYGFNPVTEYNIYSSILGGFGYKNFVSSKEAFLSHLCNKYGFNGNNAAYAKDFLESLLFEDSSEAVTELLAVAYYAVEDGYFIDIEVIMCKPEIRIFTAESKVWNFFMDNTEAYSLYVNAAHRYADNGYDTVCHISWAVYDKVINEAFKYPNEWFSAEKERRMGIQAVSSFLVESYNNFDYSISRFPEQSANSIATWLAAKLYHYNKNLTGKTLDKILGTETFVKCTSTYALLLAMGRLSILLGNAVYHKYNTDPKIHIQQLKERIQEVQSKLNDPLV